MNNFSDRLPKVTDFSGTENSKLEDVSSTPQEKARWVFHKPASVRDEKIEKFLSDNRTSLDLKDSQKLHNLKIKVKHKIAQYKAGIETFDNLSLRV